jgi:hypothetical protein
VLCDNTTVALFYLGSHGVYRALKQGMLFQVFGGNKAFFEGYFYLFVGYYFV